MNLHRKAFGGMRRPDVIDWYTLDGRLVARFRGRALESVSIPDVPGTARHRLRVFRYTRADLGRRLTRKVWGCGRGA